MTTTTGILIDPEALLDARRELLRHEVALDAVRVHPPDTGVTSALTAAALERVSATVAAVRDDLRGLADALARLDDDLTDQDDRVGAQLDLLLDRLTTRCGP